MPAAAINNDKDFQEWLRLIALEAKSGVLHLRLKDKSWRLYCLLGEIRAVAPPSDSLADIQPASFEDDLVEILIGLGREKGTPCTFSEVQEVPPPDAFLIHLPVRNLLTTLARSIADPLFIRELLTALGSRFHSSPVKNLAQHAGRLTPEEVFLLSRFESPLSVDECLVVSPFEETKTMQHFFALYLLGLIEPEGQPSGRGTAASTAGEAGRKLPPDWLTLQRDIEERNYLVSHGSFYDLLGVSRGAALEEIKEAYRGLAKRFHPDRYQAQAPKAIHDQLMNVFAHLSEAYETLSDPMRRREYDQHPGPAPAKREVMKTPPKTPILEKDLAEENFVVGKSYADHREYTKSLPYFRESVRLKPEAARYQAALGQALSQSPQHRREAEDHLRKAIELEPIQTEHYIALGLLYKDAHLPTRARKVFELALEHNPAHPIALKELGRTPPDNSAPQNLGRKFKSMFGKKK